MEKHRCRAAAEDFGLMAVEAWHGQVPSGQWELRAVVPGKGVGRGLEALHRVTTFAAIIPRGAGELRQVDVGMAIPASRRFDFVERIQALGKVALLASHDAV